MKRRNFLKSGLLIPAVATMPRAVLAAQRTFDPQPRYWRQFEVTTRVELAGPRGGRRAWLPLPAVEDPVWTRPMGNRWSGNARTMRVYQEKKYGAQMLYAEWDETESAPVVEVVSRAALRDRAIDFSVPNGARLPDAEYRLYTEPSALIPIDGIVQKTAQEAIQGARADLDKARTIYEWVVDNSFRDPETRGCGLGDVKSMLETGNLSGKCADINSLFVGLCRAVGLAARDVYGVRVADSQFGLKTLGKSGDISKAQHCRAEVFIDDFGWVPVDPADVRKVVLEERPGLTLQNPLVRNVRETLFGAWESNWLAYNFAHDVVLPNATGPMV
ncbi:MAG: transglutaminase-like domain-containing protein, partial [Burkholderiales bacterium]